MPEDPAQAAITDPSVQATHADSNAQNSANPNPTDLESLPDWAKTELRKTRDEAARYRTENKDLKTFKEQTEAEKLTGEQRATAKAEEAQSRATIAQERVLRSEIKLAAQNAQMVDPDAAYALLDKKLITLDEEGEPTNLPTLMKDLLAAKPYLAAASSGSSAFGAATGANAAGQTQATSNANAANPGRSAHAAQGQFTTSQIADRQFYLANKEAILTAYREGRIVDG